MFFQPSGSLLPVSQCSILQPTQEPLLCPVLCPDFDFVFLARSVGGRASEVMVKDLSRNLLTKRRRRQQIAWPRTHPTQPESLE